MSMPVLRTLNMRINICITTVFAFTKKLGYKTVGIFHKCAYKFDKWYDMIWMEKFIAEHNANPNDIIPYPMLNC